MLRMLLLGLAGCGVAPPMSEPPALTGITIVTPPSTDAALREFARLTPYEALVVETAPAQAHPDRLVFEVVIDEPCAQCYRIASASDDGRVWRVHTGDVLGAQYGVAAMLEAAGFRFRHPAATYVPEVLALDSASIPSDVQMPDIAQQRGLQLHVLHPIEGYFALWQPTGDYESARRIFDWIVKNRGNYVQWPALDDITADARHTQWQAATSQLLDIAHERGLGVGLAVQLFGGSNLQRAFDLADDSDAPFETQLAERLPLITSLPFDRYSLAFGEFFGADPDRFIAAVNTTVAAIHTARPGAAVHASIHVGADLRVTYRGEDMPYYFLVKHADPSIISNVHTVMYYNLFEDAGGAYEHADFFEHRGYLLDQLRAQRPAVYYPESAYWVAFDNSVPLYLPTYVRSRWLDLQGIAALARADGAAPLAGHLIFSSGFEWGYWLNDYAALRAAWRLPDHFEALIADAFGRDLAPAAALIGELAALEADALITRRLAPYLAGRDALIDGADAAGIHSQPDRITFGELRVAPWKWSAFERDVLAPLLTFTDELEHLRDRLAAVSLADTRWTREVIDGVDVTAARARFVASAYQAVLAAARFDTATAMAARSRLEMAYARGEAAVQRRHADLHDADPRLLGQAANATVYPYGYLHHTDSLCYWRRERAELAIAIDGSAQVPPTCTW